MLVSLLSYTQVQKNLGRGFPSRKSSSADSVELPMLVALATNSAVHIYGVEANLLYFITAQD